MKWSSWQAYTLVISRTWVRAPGPHPFPYIFQLMFVCRFNVLDYCIPSKSSCPRVPGHSIKGQDLGNRVRSSQRVYMLVEKSARPKAYWAQIAGLHPPN